MILESKRCAESTRARLRVFQTNHPQYRRPHLCIIQIGEDEKAVAEAAKIKEDCEKVWFQCDIQRFDPQSYSLDYDLKTFIQQRNESLTDGILVQVPFKSWLNELAVQDIVQQIAPHKDVGALGLRPIDPWDRSIYLGNTPPTATGILMLLDYYQIPIEGRRAVIVGRDGLVGKPTAEMLLHYGATVTVCHEFTPLKTTMGELLKADIIVSTVGKPGYLDEQCLGRLDDKDPVVVIDAGNGDFDDSMLQHDSDGLKIASWSKPGAVEEMGRVALLRNIYDSFRFYINKEGHWVD